MKKHLRPWVHLALALLTTMVSVLVFGQAEQTPAQATVAPGVPRLVKFGGVLKDASGNLLTNTVGITFAIYSEQTGGAPLWQETQNVQFSQGRYTVFLGDSKSTGIPAELFASGQPRWLGVKPLLPGEEEQPRVLLASVPYALKAVDADTLGGLPASAFIQANGGNSANVVIAPATTAGSSKHGVLPPSSTVTTSGGTVGTIAEFDTSTDIKSSPIVDSSGVIGIKNLESIRFADQFLGSDCGAKINAADAALGTSQGEIWVNQNCGTTWGTLVSLSAGHVLRFVQGGTYTTSLGITMASNTDIEASGVGSTILNWNGSSSGTMISAGVGTSNAYVRHIGLHTAVGGTTIALKFAGVANSTIDDVDFNGFGTQMLCTGDGGMVVESNTIYVLNSTFTDAVAAGIAADHCANLVLRNLQMGAGSTMTSLVLDSGVNGVFADLLNVFKGLHSLMLKCTGVHSSTGTCSGIVNGGISYNYPPWGIFINQGIFDSPSGEAVVFDSTLGANVVDAQFANSWIASSLVGNNLHISGGQKISWTSGGRIRGATLNGVLIDSANVSDVLIADTFITNNNQSGGADLHGIYITAAATNVRINNNRIGNITEPFSGTGSQKYGVKVAVGGVTGFNLTNNNLSNNVTGPYLSGNTASQVISNNIPLVSYTVSAGPNPLPAASSNAGLVLTVIDSTSISAEGQTCVGGSGTTATAISNGTVWKCF
jgi:hypothetical protein